MILITMPYYDSAETLKDSVMSVLNQSYQDFILLILNDGDKPTPQEILGFEHPKLRYFNLKENRGRYFADAVAVMANPFEFYLPHDSDDNSNRHRLYYLMAKQQHTKASVVYNYQEIKLRNGKIRRELYPLMRHKQIQTMRHLAHWSMLYKTEAVRGVGGIHPDFRVGYDTLLTNLVKLKYNVQCVPRVLYTRNIRDNSLTICKKTGYRSKHRQAVVKRLIKLYGRCYKDPENIEKIILSSIKPDTLKAVKSEAKRLKKEMGW